MPNYLIQKDSATLIPFTGTSAQADAYAVNFAVYVVNADNSKTYYAGPKANQQSGARPAAASTTGVMNETPKVIQLAGIVTDPGTGGNAILIDGEAYPLSSEIPYADQEFSADDVVLSATAVVAPQRGYLVAVDILSGTSVTLTLRDCPDTASGRQVWALTATTGPRRFDFPKPLPFHTGLHATIGGTSPSVKFLLGASE